MGFKDELYDFHEKVKEMQGGETEEILHSDALSALIVLNFIKYEKVPDAFLAVSALNLLNRYVKQPNSHISYKFRVHIINVLQGIKQIAQKKSVLIGFSSSSNNLLIIQFWDFQFSFQGEKFTEQIQEMLSRKGLEWDGIKKQPCAKTIFDFALNNAWISNQTMKGENLKDLVHKEETGFIRNHEYKIVNGQFVKIKNIEYRMQEENEYQKNYMRTKLCECQDKPVLLIGTFAKVWDKHVTFTMIRPYIKQLITTTICDHINLYRRDVEKVIDVTTLKENDRYYIIGYCTRYSDDDRMGIRLAMDLGFSPLFKIQDFKKIPYEIFEKTHRFSIEEYISFSQKEIFL